MSFLFTLVALCGAGLSWLGLLGLRSRSLAVDLPLAWFVGGAWFGSGMGSLRFLAGIPYRWPTALALVALPVALELGTRRRRALRGRAREPLSVHPRRWLPRPAWLFGPLSLYVVVVLGATLLHGFNTPTHTDDGIRVRAYAPMLAFADEWGQPAACEVFVVAGTVSSFVPSFAWRFTESVDHFHVNYVVLTDLLALLALAVALASVRGRPERGWAQAFALLSLPLFVYHCTSTYADAVLAIGVGAAFLFVMEFARSGEWADAARALLLFAAASMGKREGEPVAVVCASILLAQFAWTRRRSGGEGLARLLLFFLPALLAAVTKAAAAGLERAFPLVEMFFERATGSTPSGQETALRGTAVRAFAYALFDSGNAGVLFWVMPAAVLVRLAQRRLEQAGSLAMVGALLAMAAVSSIWFLPEFTLDQTTLHRSLLVVELPAALWLAADLASRSTDLAERPGGLLRATGALAWPPAGPRPATTKRSSTGTPASPSAD